MSYLRPQRQNDLMKQFDLLNDQYEALKKRKSNARGEDLMQVERSMETLKSQVKPIIEELKTYNPYLEFL
jgi:hypothetical protein